jgi:hypothetical protein
MCVLLLTSPTGPTSNVAFVRHISLAIAKASGDSQAIQSRPNSTPTTLEWMRVTRPHYVHGEINESTLNLPQRSVNIYTLPPEAYTWKLIKEYFQKTGLLLPFIHEESFCETYFQMKEANFSMARRTWLGLLNMILAMATTLSVDGYASSQERIEESDAYYQRAHGLCEKESRTNISLELGTAPLLRHHITSYSHGALTTTLSAIFAHRGSISSRNAKVGPGVDSSRSCDHDCVSTGSAFSENKSRFSPDRERDSKARLVWLHSSGSVRLILPS